MSSAWARSVDLKSTIDVSPVSSRVIRSIRPSTVMPGRYPDLDLLLGVQGVLQPGPVLLHVPPDGADRGAAQVGAQGRICERGVQVLVHQVIGVQAGDDVAVDGALVDLGHHVVDGLAVAEGLVDRRVEPVQEPELELIRALEEVLQVTEAERDLRHFVPRPRVEPAGQHACPALSSGSTGSSPRSRRTATAPGTSPSRQGSRSGAGTSAPG